MSIATARWTAPSLLAVALLLAGWGVVRRSAEAATSVTLPVLQSTENSVGAQIARIDDQALRTSFAELGLPPPPICSGLEAPIVELVLQCARDWAERRDGDALGRLGCVQLGIEQKSAALAWFAAAERFGTQRERWVYLLGATCQSLSLDEPARNALESARTLDARQALTHARLGELYLEAQRLPEALASFEQALKLAPDLSVAAVGLARARLAHGDVQSAFNAAQAAVRMQPRDFAARRVLADVLARLGRAAEAEREAAIANQLPRYQGWGTFDPRLREAMDQSLSLEHLPSEASSALAVNALDHARRLVERLVARRPRDGKPLRLLAGITATQGEHARARELIERALATAPGDLDVLTTSAEIAIAAGDGARALRDVDQILAKTPNDAAARSIAARALFATGKVDEALALAQRLALESPDAHEPHVLLLEMLRLAQRPAQARELLENAVRRKPLEAWARTELARESAPAGANR